ncbi:hypothetical protein [Nannocystis sp.]|uniref:hypothetical protein n=1 Tax=Nannocystis sp. TaxID=1962667 RepID=UPI0025DDDEE2|nr:hypothetical protein [Nannocystis sp.]MBK7828235.1 hypothetical protein [Nannocystis sp.]
MRRSAQRFALILSSSLAFLACPHEEPEVSWQLVHRDLPGALLSVWGTSVSDVWAVGGDARDGTGPLVIHFDGDAWTRVATGETQGNLWWVFGFADGPIYMGGEGGVILRQQDGAFTRMATPSLDTVYGIWGATPDDLWAVGGASDSNGGFAWRLTGDTWTPEPTLPADIAGSAAIWKLFGSARDDAWLVGSNGVALHWDGKRLGPGDTGVGSSLFTVHERDGKYAAVGGLATGIIVEYDGASWQTVTPDPPPMGLSGVTLGADGFGVAVGSYGGVYTRSDAGWAAAELGFTLAGNLHGSWIDEDGGVWAVGGQTFSPPFTDGTLIHRGAMISGNGL